MENLLYYPYINVPKSEWAARALLYYDRVGSIVPQSYFYDPDNYDPHMRSMVMNGLIEPIDPLSVLDNPWEISRPFISYINSRQVNLYRRRERFRNGHSGRVSRNKFVNPGPGEPRIHIDKFDGEIFYQLEQAGLAIREDHKWYIVEKKTANELMIFLASVLGEKLNYRPTTDQIQTRHKLVHDSKKEFRLHKMRDHKRETILNELVPFPEEIDLRKLRVFKDQNADLLKSFKNQVELIVLNPSFDDNPDFFAEKITELKLRKEELSAKMNKSSLGGILFGTVCGIASVGVGMFAAQGGMSVNNLPGIANAIYSALQIERGEHIFDQSGMKYLALVDKKIRHRTN